MENSAEKVFPLRPVIVFMGTPEFAVSGLEALIGAGHNVAAVVTQPDRPKGRGRKRTPSPVKQTALRNGIEVLQPENASEEGFCRRISDKGPDILIVVAFGQILRRNLLRIPRWGVLNIHASLLPRYRGAAPIQWAILNNETRTGLTAMRMEEGLDTGPILLQEAVDIPADETAGELHDRLARISGGFLLKTLQGLSENRLRERPQDHSRATYAGKIDRKMARIKWERPAEAVSALIRGLDPWPGAYTTLNGKEIKLFSSRVVQRTTPGGVPGRVAGLGEGSLLVETGSGIVEIRALQLQGKKRLPAEVFLRGLPLSTGTLFGS